MLFSANIGFLWDHLPLPARIDAAGAAGFDAVECHFPYEYSAHEINEALARNDLKMVGMNTSLGPEGCFGLAAISGREEQARELIDQAIDYAVAIDAANINVVAGLTSDTEDDQTYCRNLTYACGKAAIHNKNIVIEPLNPRSVPGYHFSHVEQAVSIIQNVDADNLKIMFDFFHAQIVQGDLETLIKSTIKHIGHIQISAVHDRGEPDTGEINYPYLLNMLKGTGYNGYIGAEYKPRGKSVDSGLAWLESFRMQLNRH